MSYRLSLPENDGILFEFDRVDDHAFWMESVSIPLDIIFLSDYNYVTHIHQHARPNSTSPISSGRPIKRVLEANAGWCSKNGVTVGTEVVFSGV